LLKPANAGTGWRMKESYVFDASALIDFSEAGPGIRKVEQILQAAAREQAVIFVSAMNLGEVFYWTWQKRGEAEAQKAVASLSRLPIDIVLVDLPHALKAGEIKALHHIPYVDCLAAALATLKQAMLVTADRDFEKLGRNFPVLWLPRR
jgi:predicted nucleic acid-binding protein